ncbi:hypothetical protein B0H34DRAFT_856183 [Crassisporium funariophilum]|nr:hypothetical protein B0H34DRAFT_856183 [Crassisporium funariophilum]
MTPGIVYHNKASTPTPATGVDPVRLASMAAIVVIFAFGSPRHCLQARTSSLPGEQDLISTYTRFLRTARVNREVTFLAVALLERYSQTLDIWTRRNADLEKLFLVAHIVADKLISDKAVFLTFWAEVGDNKYGCEDLADTKVDFCRAMKGQFYFTSDATVEWLRELLDTTLYFQLFPIDPRSLNITPGGKEKSGPNKAVGRFQLKRRMMSFNQRYMKTCSPDFTERARLASSP